MQFLRTRFQGKESNSIFMTMDNSYAGHAWVVAKIYNVETSRNFLDLLSRCVGRKNYSRGRSRKLLRSSRSGSVFIRNLRRKRYDFAKKRKDFHFYFVICSLKKIAKRF